ncbi:putative F-box protein At1g20795 [Nicotiana tabacum]|uniref:F-box protein At1g20795 n=1 Tax=Nicotiana tabacum TaxID=4097 RepID=A0AC58U2T1_TOBAC
MDLNEDLVVEIISHLPLKFAIQCKVLCKNFNTRISDPKFSQTWLFQHQKIISILIYSSDRVSKNFHKISINSIRANHYKTTLPVQVEVLASCKGLLLLNFHQVRSFCVFNPITGAHQLIPHPKSKKYKHTIGDTGFVVDYPTSDQYKLVRVGKLAKEEGYRFQVFSSEGSGGVWHEFRSRMKLKLGNTFSYLVAGSRPVYVHDSLHWLTCDRRILAFNTKRKEAIILNFPDFINHTHDFIYDKWLGVVQVLLTLICTFEEFVVISAYDYLSNNWRVSHTVANFITGLDGYNYCFPVCFDSKQVLFLVNRILEQYDEQYDELYEYDSKMNEYKIAAVLDKGNAISSLPYTFEPTLASVHKTLSDTVTAKHLSTITATLDEFRRFITDS